MKTAQKTYEMNPIEYRTISGIAANIAASKQLEGVDKKQNYLALRAEYLDARKNDPENTLAVFTKWLNELNTAAGYVPKTTKTTPAKNPAKSLNNKKVSTERSERAKNVTPSAIQLQLAEMLKSANLAPTPVKKQASKAAGHNNETQGSDIMKQVKEGKLSARTALRMEAKGLLFPSDDELDELIILANA